MAVSKAAAGRLVVNPILCTGRGYCAEIVPELITLDEWGFPMVDVVRSWDENVKRMARRAVETCPRVALALLEADPERPV